MKLQMKAATGGLRPLRRLAVAHGTCQMLKYMLCWGSQGVCWLQGQRQINKKDSACFWWSLYIMVSDLPRDWNPLADHVSVHATTVNYKWPSPLSLVMFGLQPVVWVLLGVIALVKISVGKLLIVSVAFLFSSI